MALNRDLAAGLRFLIAGGFNTLITGAALSLLALVIEPRAAYGIVFVAGIILSLVLSGRFVFQRRITWQRCLGYVVMYLVVFGIGLAALQLALRAGLPSGLSGLVALVTAPLTFLGGRLLFWGYGPEDPESGEPDERVRPPAGDL